MDVDDLPVGLNPTSWLKPCFYEESPLLSDWAINRPAYNTSYPGRHPGTPLGSFAIVPMPCVPFDAAYSPKKHGANWAY
ncbi:hypothetical protein GCM10007924_31410 [Sneathiella chinensis]|uniref:Uncharacterized protein n=1 Tax=Sneathiella chinensis TaxID=349750 RepID=A0ABQ5U7N7_9PROT|nr:hypothetical protein GCM10007924_31410 [Sneathiella chinensis]